MPNGRPVCWERVSKSKQIGKQGTYLDELDVGSPTESIGDDLLTVKTLE